MYRFAVRHGLKVPIRRGSLDICPRIPASFGANVLDGLLLEVSRCVKLDFLKAVHLADFKYRSGPLSCASLNYNQDPM